LDDYFPLDNRRYRTVCRALSMGGTSNWWLQPREAHAITKAVRFKHAGYERHLCLIPEQASLRIRRWPSATVQTEHTRCTQYAAYMHAVPCTQYHVHVPQQTDAGRRPRVGIVPARRRCTTSNMLAMHPHQADVISSLSQHPQQNRPDVYLPADRNLVLTLLAA
jgi:hypothetical protein